MIKDYFWIPLNSSCSPHVPFVSFFDPNHNAHLIHQILDESTSGFLVGDSMSMADIMVFDGLCYLHEDPKLKSELQRFPRCSVRALIFSAKCLQTIVLLVEETDNCYIS